MHRGRRARLGKSRLLTEFEESAADARVYRARCLPYGEGITYWPVSEVVKRAAGILQTDEADVVAGKLDFFLRASHRAIGRAADGRGGVSNLVGGTRTPGAPTQPSHTKAELHWGIRRLLELLSRTSRS